MSVGPSRAGSYSLTPQYGQQRNTHEERPDEFQYTLVGHPCRDARHQGIVVHSIKEFLEIKIDHDAVAFGNIGLRLCHRLMRRACWPEAVAVLGECRVPTLLQDLQQRLLDQSIDDTRHAELPDPAVGLRYLHPPDRLRPIGSAEQLGPNVWPMLTQVARGDRRWSSHRRPEPLCCLARAATHARGSPARTASSMRCIVAAGLSGSITAMTGSAPALPTSEASPRSLDIRVGWRRVFCRDPLMRCRSYLPLPVVRAFDHRFRLGLSVAPPFGLECLTSLADSMAYYALC